MRISRCLMPDRFAERRFEYIEVGREVFEIEIARYLPFVEALASAGEEIDLRAEVAFIPGGTFLMGASSQSMERLAAFDQPYGIHLGQRETPQHQVNVQGFAISRAPIALGLWDAVAELFGLDMWDQRQAHGPWLPVHGVSRPMLQEFLEKTSTRLPSEAEWEYACRGGTQTTFFTGDDETTLVDYAFYGMDTGPFSVGQKLPNPFGLYDMPGNVWEWCADDYADDYSNASGDARPFRDESEARGVIRGGSYATKNVAWLASAFRSEAGIYSTSGEVGFRIVVELEN